MKIIQSKTAEELGKKAARQGAELLRQYINQNNTARLLLSTGASQLTTLNALINEPIDWTKVEMFHLDEYIGLPPTHPASFVKYLQERFIEKVKPGKVHLVDTTGDINGLIASLTKEVSKKPIDVGFIGIGENAHIAFNDPPADLENDNSFIVVTLAESCRRQQMGEGWFKTLEDVPAQAVTMTVREILKCRHIISAVPFDVKAKAVYDTLNAPDITPMVPATALRRHPDVTIYLDEGSAKNL